MGLIIISGLFWLGTIIYLAFICKEKTDSKMLLFVLGLILFFASALLASRVFVWWGEPELVQTYDLAYAEQNGSVYYEDKNGFLSGADVEIKVTYEVSYQSDEEVYIFVDNENIVYIIKEDSVVIKTTKDVVERNDGTKYKAEVVLGNYEKPYMEKYKKIASKSFLSMGGVKYEYKFYIPEDVAK